MYGCKKRVIMDGVILTPLKRIPNPKGDILHAMKISDEGYNGFGEAYFSSVHQSDIKGWKKHSKMTLNLVVPQGAVEFVIYNEQSQKFMSVELSEKNYQRLTIAPGLWLAFKGVEANNILLNLASIEHDPNEAVNLNLEDIKYEW
jgi:dTDP-4-dehydrorhamnose 3,5-epimerase